MTVFVDYRYSGVSPVAPNWLGIKPDVTLNFPLPPAGGMKHSPPYDDVSPVHLTAPQLHWAVSTMGYGEAADYALTWLLKGKAMGTAEIADLWRLARTRALMLTRAYQTQTHSSGLLTLQPREIYPLIETTEKTCVSYYLGSAMTAICAPYAVATRGPAIGIQYLFHAKLLATAAKLGKTVVVNSKSGKHVDFVGFDLQLGVHLFEAKGDGEKFPYGALASGLDQSLAVLNVTFPDLLPPLTVAAASINTCVAFHGRQKVDCQTMQLGDSMRCAVFALPDSDSLSSRLPSWATGGVRSAVSLLAGVQILGLYAQLQTGTRHELQEGWTAYHFPTEGIDLRLPMVAVPSELVRAVNDLLERFLSDSRKTSLTERLQRDLQGQSQPLDIDGERRAYLTRLLGELGLQAMGNDSENGRSWAKIAPPAGFVRLAGESWLAFEAR